MTGRTRVAVKLRLTKNAKWALETCAAEMGQTVSDWVAAQAARNVPNGWSRTVVRAELAEARRVAAGRRGA